MDWSDEAFVLSARRNGETSVVVQLLTRAHGRHSGLMRGGAGPRGRAIVETGNLVQASWRARLSEQLGQLRLELLRAHAARLIERAVTRRPVASTACTWMTFLARSTPTRAIAARVISPMGFPFPSSD